MANPKRRFSKARTRTRRSTWFIQPASYQTCPQCHEPRLPHRVCPHCGYYRGRQVITMTSDSGTGEA